MIIVPEEKRGRNRRYTEKLMTEFLQNQVRHQSTDPGSPENTEQGNYQKNYT